MNIVAILVLCLLLFRSAEASERTDTLRHTPGSLVRRAYPDYDEEILYYGKHNEYFTVKVFKKDGSLFRQDSYSLLPKTLSNGLQLDSLSRILHHGPTKIMYPSGQIYVSCEYKENLLQGPFMVFHEDGSIKRREFYRGGRITKSKCFASDGSEQKCEAFYQAAKFLGRTKDLQTYLKQKMEPVLDGEQVRNVMATLLINEIGQIIRVYVDVKTNTASQNQVLTVRNYVQQVIKNMPEWTPEKLNWKPAINDGKAITSTCILSIYRINGSIQYQLNYQM